MLLIACILLKQTYDIDYNFDYGDFVAALSGRPRILTVNDFCYYRFTCPYPLRMLPTDSELIKVANRIGYEKFS